MHVKNIILKNLLLYLTPSEIATIYQNAIKSYDVILIDVTMCKEAKY